jgi:hypothetical protein
MIQTSPATTKHPTIIVMSTGIQFHLTNSNAPTVLPFCFNIVRHSSPASDAEKLSRREVSWLSSNEDWSGLHVGVCPKVGSYGEGVYCAIEHSV